MSAIRGSNVAAGCALVLTLGCAPASPRADEPPSFLVVVVDDWSHADWEHARRDEDPWNDLPVMDRLAAAGQSWDRFYSQPVCASTRITLMFGRYHGEALAGSCAKPGPHTPPAGTPSLASVLKGAGYATGAFGKWHIASHPDPEQGWERAPGAYGFDTWRAMSASNVGGHCHSKNYSEWHRVDDGEARTTNEYHTTAVTDAARDWWASTDGPKLAYVAYQAPHQPFHVPPAQLLPAGMPEPRTKRAEYDAMLVALDAELGRLLEVVDREHTWVFVLGDNGTPAAAARPDAQDARRLKSTTFEGGIRVPFLVAGPDLRPRDAAPAGARPLGHVVELLATCAELAGAPPPAGLDSVSLVPALRDPRAQPRTELVCEYLTPERGERSKIRARLEERGLEVSRHREIAVVARSEGGELVKLRWTRSLESGAEQVRWYRLPAGVAEPGEAELTPQERRRLRSVFEAYAARLTGAR